MYACYARDWTVMSLTGLYQHICKVVLSCFADVVCFCAQLLLQEHNIDAILLIDGGSDSLMVTNTCWIDLVAACVVCLNLLQAGDENELGDPIEDAVSIAAAANCAVKAKILVSIGFGSGAWCCVLVVKSTFLCSALCWRL
jgi:hypothetical protein